MLGEDNRELLKNYEISIKNRLTHLQEQISIAKALDIPKQIGYVDPSILDNLEYNRGYIALQQEMEIIKNLLLW